MASSTVQRALPFRLLAGLALVMVLALILMHYLEKAHRMLERQSVEQQTRVINSALVVVFSTYAVEGRLYQLQELDGANPFVFLKQFNIALNNYRGESLPGADLAPGWYYDPDNRSVFFKPVYLEENPGFRVVFDYIDYNGDGRYTRAVDAVRSLRLDRMGWF